MSINIPALIPNYFDELYPKIIEGIQKDESQVAIQLTYILGDVCKVAGNQVSQFSEHYEDLITLLIDFSLNTENSPVNGDVTQNGICAWATIYNLIEHTPDSKTSQLSSLIEKFFAMVNATHDESDRMHSRRDEF